ncbi:Sterol uptake control protein 2 [Madurella mycetomatis]|uniref:Sterol uptake control protein 2 n=1 Tax=Madurella mycetomatis TaxID=100816 RepID=A0A175W1X6_9PEZI|nr:Sterol uptake control protein 2 [Madurella mycetomatis]
MPPRRSHKKSRAGCRRCKSRKIKCDEVHPRCGNCVKHGVPCDFEHPEVLVELRAAAAAAATESPSTPATTVHFGSPILNASGTASGPSGPSGPPGATLYRAPPAPSVSQTTPPGQRLLELRLMHQYTAMTCKTFTFTAPVTEEIWKITVPSLAFSGSQHLADAILAVAALHLRSMMPNDKELVRASHAYMAASLAEYSAALTKGIDHTNAESLFLTSTLIAFQSTATRVFMKDELAVASGDIDADADKRRQHGSGCYAIPFSWFHSFQGVKAITAASWQYLRVSPVVTQVINSQAVLQLDFTISPDTFFGHLLEGLDEELAAMEGDPTGSARTPQGGIPSPATPTSSSFSPAADPSQQSSAPELVARTRQAYQHAVAVLNWAHKIPHKGAPLAFPATVSRRYIELLEERRPRAMAILACFFALLKSMDGVWWLQGMARREVLGVVSLFNSDFFGPDAYRTWWPHLEWAMRIALYEHDARDGPIPPEIWGADWYAEERALAEGQENGNYFKHIEMLSQMGSAVNSIPSPEYVAMNRQR